MPITDLFSANFNKNNLDRRVYSLLSTLIVIVGLFIAAGVLFPTTVSIILNTLWIVMVTLVIIFFVLGILVIIGMRREVGKILDALLEGSLKIIDFLDLLRRLWKRFVELVKEFLIFAAPFFAYVSCLLLYILLLYIYKSVGKTYDVTLLTIILTMVTLIAFAMVNKPQPEIEDPKWGKKFSKRFRAGFIDGFEVVLFVFFLTMDSTGLFFLPASLNVPLHAQFQGYDFMVRSIVYKNHTAVTVDLIIATILLEVVRNTVRIYAAARRYYLEYLQNPITDEGTGIMATLKHALRKAFSDAKNDLTSFITLNTVLFAVFLFFPRLKLLALATASVTNLSLDLIIRSRLIHRKGTDLISRSLSYIFRL